MGAPLNPVPSVLKIVLKGFIDNLLKEVWANVLHFRYSGSAPDNASCAALANLVANRWSSFMAPACPSPTSLASVQVTDLTSDTSGQGEQLVSTHGTRGDDSIAANGAVLISYPSALRYKGGHPRTYLYVLGNADFNGAMEWTTAATAEVQGDWQAFLNAVQTLSNAGTSMGNFCSVRYHGKFLPNGGPPHYYLDTPLVNIINTAEAIAHTQIASQRRRIGREEGGAPQLAAAQTRAGLR
jgi:hypothetical protein